MNLLWFTWKDRKNPLAGGAELVNEELAKRLVENGYKVIFLVARFKGGAKEEMIDGYKVVRLGNRWTVYFKVWRYYKKHLQGWSDLVIDEVNAIPFFAKFYVKKRNILFIHQLCRQIWFYEMFFPLNIIGDILEPIYLKILSDREVITVSGSTKNDLRRYGFRTNNIHIIPLGIEIEPLKILPPLENIKEKEPTILYLGSIRRMKRPEEVLKAFRIAKKEISNLKLWIVGEGQGKYFEDVKCQMSNVEDITYFGKVGKEKKVELLQKAHLICATSVKEGWGLVVTEANSQGTPAVVYNVDGLRDSVRNKETGLVCEKNIPDDLANKIIYLLENKQEYEIMRKNAWQWSIELNFEKSAKDFESIIRLVD